MVDTHTLKAVKKDLSVNSFYKRGLLVVVLLALSLRLCVAYLHIYFFVLGDKNQILTDSFSCYYLYAGLHSGNNTLSFHNVRSTVITKYWSFCNLSAQCWRQQ